MATPKDILVSRLLAFAANRQIAYGHQDDLAYGHSWTVDDWQNDSLERSDVKDVAGKYPMVAGFDLGGIEHGAQRNINNVHFGLMRKATLKHIERGGIVTFSWHVDNILTGGTAWDVSSNQVVKAVLPGGEKHTEFMLWMKRAADYLESLGDVAVIFRPWHEHTGGWFWWGQNLCTSDEYKSLFRMTWNYFAKKRGLANILWCYSPNGPVTQENYMERYPGDEFIDILGADFYEAIGTDGLRDSGNRFAAVLKELLATMTAIAENHRKPIALSETGLESLPDSTWWTDVLNPAIKDFPLCYVLTWRNAYNHPRHFFAPWNGFHNAMDFKAFSTLDNIVFLDVPPRNCGQTTNA